MYEIVCFPNLDPGLHIPLVSDITSREGGRKYRDRLEVHKENKKKTNLPEEEREKREKNESQYNDSYTDIKRQNPIDVGSVAAFVFSA